MTVPNDGIGTWIDRRRVKSASRPALICDETTVTYDLLAER
ncbi:MAG: hypothetical protein QOI16_1161, partial [Pseudonocardiales bacterium]|nr:hypothetical protein [Pseudonocardiales bacterium]